MELALYRMRINRVFLWIEGVIILVPLCIFSVIVGVMSIGFMLMLLGDPEFFTMVLPFIACVVTVVWLTRVLFGYLFYGEERLRHDEWWFFIVLNALVSSLAVFGAFEALFGGTRGWEQSVAQYWPGKSKAHFFMIGLPAVLPAIHMSVLTYKANLSKSANK